MNSFNVTLKLEIDILYKYIYTFFINQYFRQTIEFFIKVYRRLLLILHLVFSLRTRKVS